MKKTNGLYVGLLLLAFTCITLFNSCKDCCKDCCKQAPPAGNEKQCDSCLTIPQPQTSEIKELDARDHYIKEEAAAEMTNEFKAKIDKITNNSLDGKTKVIPYAQDFNRKAIQSLLLQDSCIGMRISYGLNSNNQMVAILSAITPSGRIINTPEIPCIGPLSYYCSGCKVELSKSTY